MIADKDEHIKTILSVIPEKPGCYQYFDENGTIIYLSLIHISEPTRH